jgi:hypothetical protein
MMTRSKMSLKSNWTNLPVELISIILSLFSFKQVVKISEVSKSMSTNVDFIMRYLTAINDKISVNTINYVVKKCKAVNKPPYICGATDYNIYAMRQVLKRWPDYLHLNWDMTGCNTISMFLRSVSTSSFRQINHMSLKVDMNRFLATKINLHYMDLESLTIEGEACDLRDIMIGINCRCWDIGELYLRGDVTDLGSLMMYAPAVSSKITIINTNDNIDTLTMGMEEGLRYLLNTIKNVHLCNIMKYCCDPPYTCMIVDLFVFAITTSLFVPRNGTWTVDRLNVDMIEALVVNGIQVVCGVFKSEMKRLKVLEREHPNKIFVSSVL